MQFVNLKKKSWICATAIHLNSMLELMTQPLTHLQEASMLLDNAAHTDTHTHTHCIVGCCTLYKSTNYIPHHACWSTPCNLQENRSAQCSLLVQDKTGKYVQKYVPGILDLESPRLHCSCIWQSQFFLKISTKVSKFCFFPDLLIF